MTPIALRDSSFTGQLSLSLGGENQHVAPCLIEWDCYNSQDLTVFTDKHLLEVIKHKGRAVALLVEPPSLSQNHYNQAHELASYFEWVLSPWRTFCGWRPNFVHYPVGGSWIALVDWGLRKKTKDISIIVSEKTRAPGHYLRHEVVDRLGPNFPIDAWGRGFRPTPSKWPALAPYKYSIVIESIACYGYFSEKLIDCLSVGTIPLYWGAPDIQRYFPGIPQWHDLGDLEHLLNHLPEVSDETRQDWFGRALQYICAEDWIALNTEVFK